MANGYTLSFSSLNCNAITEQMADKQTGIVCTYTQFEVFDEFKQLWRFLE
jgi:hypothetical protein